MKKVILALAAAGAVYAGTVVTVNGKKITDAEVQEVLMQGTQGRFNQLPPEKKSELANRVVDGLITQELIFSDAEKTGVLKSAEYKKELEQVLERVKVQLASKVWEKREFDKVKVSDKDVEAYFKAHPEEFSEKEKVRASHILVKTEAEAKDLINEVKGLRDGALSSKFAELAKSKSTGPSGPKGGDLGFFAKGQMVPAFNDAAFSMKKGTVSKTPVKSQFGYHVILVTDKQNAKDLPLTEVKGFIKQKLQVEAFKDVMAAKMEALKKKAKIVFDQK